MFEFSVCSPICCVSDACVAFLLLLVSVQRRVCDAYRHSWVVVVGSTRDYPSLQAFVDARCLQMQMKETNGGGGMFEGARKKYEFSVTDPVEGQLTNTVALPT